MHQNRRPELIYQAQEHVNTSFLPNPGYVVSANSIISHLSEVNLKFIGF